MKQNKVHNVTYLKERRRELRNNATPSERRLWQALKDSQLGNRKFRRQHSIDNYIVDFYCPEEKLIIELDGAVHNDPGQAIYDFERDEHIKGRGFRVLRFENHLIFNNLEGVLDLIASHFRQ